MTLFSRSMVAGLALMLTLTGLASAQNPPRPSASTPLPAPAPNDVFLGVTLQVGPLPSGGGFGLLVLEVKPNSPAHLADIRVGDVIKGLDDGTGMRPATNGALFRQAIQALAPGRAVVLDIDTPAGPWGLVTATLDSMVVTQSFAPVGAAPGSVQPMRKATVKVQASNPRPVARAPMQRPIR